MPDWRNTIMHPDGLHMSAAGNAFIFEAVTAIIASSHPALAPEALPLHFPSFDKVNVAAPGDTFDRVYGRRGAGASDAPAAAAAAAAERPVVMQG